MKIATVSVRDIRKNVPVLQVKVSSPAPPTLSETRVVLIHTEYVVVYGRSLSEREREAATIYLLELSKYLFKLDFNDACLEKDPSSSQLCLVTN